MENMNGFFHIASNPQIIMIHRAVQNSCNVRLAFSNVGRGETIVTDFPQSL